MKPTIVVFTGDPAGIGGEVAAKALADPAVSDAAHYIVLGSRAPFEEARKLVGLEKELEHCDPRRAEEGDDKLQFARWARDGEIGFEVAKVTAENGKYMLDGLAEGLRLCAAGIADGMCVAPLNKAALRAGGMNHPDEMNYFKEVLSFQGPTTEFNVNESIWTARVTSHVPLKDVASLLTEDKIIQGVKLLHDGLKSAGFANPRIGICGLNPHNGESGAFGREEIEIITPAADRARELGYNVFGPLSADTIFVQAKKANEGFDGILTMYHDQGQIAMKLMSFGRGVTVHYGLPMPVTTPSHGTAYDIVGKGIATPEAMKNALLTVARMGLSNREERQR